jgi:hypothetical protein
VNDRLLARWRREVAEATRAYAGARALVLREMTNKPLVAVSFRRRTALLLGEQVAIDEADIRFTIERTPDFPFRPPLVAGWGACPAGGPPAALWHPNLAPIVDGAPVCLFSPWPIGIGIRQIVHRLLALATFQHYAVDPRGSFNADAARWCQDEGNRSLLPTDGMGLAGESGRDSAPRGPGSTSGFTIIETASAGSATRKGPR